MQFMGLGKPLTKLSPVHSEIRKIKTSEFFIKITLKFLKSCLSHIFSDE